MILAAAELVRKTILRATTATILTPPKSSGQSIQEFCFTEPIASLRIIYLTELSYAPTTEFKFLSPCTLTLKRYPRLQRPEHARA